MNRQISRTLIASLFVMGSGLLTGPPQTARADNSPSVPLSAVKPENTASQGKSDASRTSAATAVWDAVQDTKGNVWGIVFAPRLSVARWDGSQWNLTSPPAGIAGEPRKLAAGADGTIFAAWSNGAVVEFSGIVSRLMGTVAGQDKIVTLFPDKNDVWAIGQTGDIFRLDRRADAATAVRQVYKSVPANFFPNFQPDADNGQRPLYVPVRVTRDSLGRLWFWAQGIGQGDNLATLRGFLLWDGAEMRRIPKIEGIPDARFDCVAQRDAGHLWIGVHNEGMFSVDLHTLASTPVPNPEQYAFKAVQKMGALGTDWVVITQHPGNIATPDNPGGAVGVVWIQKEGVWRKLLSGLDTSSGFRSVADRPLVLTSVGLWLGSYGSGAWLLPMDGSAPHHLDWRCGYSLFSTDRLLPAPSAQGGLIAVQLSNPNTTRSFLQPNTERFATAGVDPSIHVLQTPRRLIQDRQARLWNVAIKPDPNGSVGTLDAWDGTAWSSVALPIEANAAALKTAVLDSRNRIWVIMFNPVQNMPEYRVFIFDIDSGTWSKFPTWDDALKAQAAALVAEAKANPTAPAFHLDRSFESPSFHGTTVTYGENSTIHYFDGETWHEYRRPNISGDTGFAFDGAPFFDDTGALCINMNNNPHPAGPAQYKTWRALNVQTWSAGAFQKGPYDWSPPAQLHAPAGAVTPDPFSIAKDRNGAFWLVSKGMLYKAATGQCEAKFGPNDPNPFVDGRRLQGVLIDPRGNAVLHTVLDQRQEYVFIPMAR